ncbi:MAG: hypothetical protein EOP01_03660, partial [Propionibacteriaceae bacterium]
METLYLLSYRGLPAPSPEGPAPAHKDTRADGSEANSMVPRTGRAWAHPYREAVKTTEQRLTVPGPDGEIQAVVIEPVGAPSRCGVLYYTDIFQLTESTLRTARRLSAEGFVVCLPEIYPRDFPGAALAFDDAGKADGLAGAAATTTAQFDADRDAVLAYLTARPDLDTVAAVGFCLGGHLAFRAAFDPRVSATVCFYPTGLHDGSLGADVADSL